MPPCLPDLLINLLLFSGEYRNLVGENIPYRNLGYGALQDFLEDSKAVCKVAYAQDGSAIVRGVGSDETSHIEVSLRIDTATFV